MAKQMNNEVEIEGSWPALFNPDLRKRGPRSLGLCSVCRMYLHSSSTSSGGLCRSCLLGFAR